MERRKSRLIENDDNMKVVYFKNRGFGSSGKKQADDSEEYLRQKECGNLARAKDLGAQIAEFVAQDEDFYGLSEVSDLFDREELQVRQLLCYTVVTVLHHRIVPEFLAEAAVADFLQALEKSSPEIYRHFAEGSSYSMYLLSRYRGGEPELEVGKTFAMLCGIQDAVTVEYGETLYSCTEYVISEMIRQMDWNMQ